MANNNDINLEEQSKLEESLSLLEHIQTIPAYKVGEKAVELYGEAKEKYKEFASWEGKVLNQLLFDLGAQTYNAAAVPMNILGGFFAGYNPGFSGERFMESMPWEEGVSSFAERPQARFDPDYPWGVFAPEGGERQTAIAPQGPVKQDIIPVEKEAPITDLASTSYMVNDIDPKTKEVFDRILDFDQDKINTFFNKLAPNQRDALLEYRNSLTESQLAEENKKKNAPNL